MIQRPTDITAFEFVRLASLRTTQLVRGCRARVEVCRRHSITAQSEVAQYKVMRVPSVATTPVT